MWMVNPKILCTKHLGGEHVEVHMFLGHMNKQRSVTGYVRNNLFDSRMHKRHKELANELIRRKKLKYPNKHIEHKTPFDIELFKKVVKINKGYLHHRVDSKKSQADLLKRCEACRSRYKLLTKDNEFKRR